LRVLTEKKKNDQAFGFVDEEALYRIIIKEQDKTWLTKWVDDDNRSGFFRGYKSICKKMAELIRECNPAYPYPSSLVSTVMMTSLHQMFYAEHLPSLSDLHKDDHEQLYTFVENLVFSTLRK